MEILNDGVGIDVDAFNASEIWGIVSQFFNKGFMHHMWVFFRDFCTISSSFHMFCLEYTY